MTQQEVKKLFNYNPRTGEFIWISRNYRNVKIGSIAGSTEMKGYRVINIMNKSYKAHRLAWLYIHGEFPSGQIDHINGIRDDNAIINLRVVDTKENCKNQRVSKRNKSGFNGVHYHKKHKNWQASIGVNNKLIYLGSFSEKKLAIDARKQANIKYGFHENHGK